ncbi:MAG: energy-coupling factor transporter transmembrane component T family protein [Candidatus Heteroscillospira sp.]|jgi:energy-coupling factor transport system permease protein
MLKDVTLGQFFPGNTPAHRLDPRTKLILTFLYIIALFAVSSFTAYGIMALVLFACMRISHVRFSVMVRGLKPLMLVIALTAFINAFFTGGEDVIFSLGFLHLTWGGLRRAVFMLLRIAMLVCGTFLLTYTTSPLAITDGLEKIMTPLKKLKVPVHDISMMMSIALRFIPTLIGETDKIMSAQKARGASFDTGNLAQRAKALLPLLVPLFVSAFKRADELAVAMECRCYNGGVGRTRMKELSYSRSDFLVLAAGCAITALMFVFRFWGVLL